MSPSTEFVCRAAAMASPGEASGQGEGLPLLQAVARRDLPALVQLLRAPAPAPGHEGMTALHVAVLVDCAEAVPLLLAAGEQRCCRSTHPPPHACC